MENKEKELNARGVLAELILFLNTKNMENIVERKG